VARDTDREVWFAKVECCVGPEFKCKGVTNRLEVRKWLLQRSSIEARSFGWSHGSPRLPAEGFERLGSIRKLLKISKWRIRRRKTGKDFWISQVGGEDTLGVPHHNWQVRGKEGRAKSGEESSSESRGGSQEVLQTGTRKRKQ